MFPFEFLIQQQWLNRFEVHRRNEDTDMGVGADSEQFAIRRVDHVIDGLFEIEKINGVLADQAHDLCVAIDVDC